MGPNYRGLGPVERSGHGTESPLAWNLIWPWGALSRDRSWNLLWVRWFIFYALFPFALLTLIGEGQWLGPVVLGFGVYFALTWLVILTACLQPERVRLGQLAGIALFSGTAGIVLTLVATAVLPIGWFSLLIGSNLLVLRWLGFVVGVGLIEEAVKGLAVYLGVGLQARRLDPVTFAYAGVISGLGFGISEAVAYSYDYRAAIRQEGPEQLPSYLLIQLLRLICLPLLHACFTGIFGYFLGLAYARRTQRWLLILVGLAIPAVLHGTYNTFAAGDFGLTGLLLAGLTIVMFVGYMREAETQRQLSRPEEGPAPAEVSGRFIPPLPGAGASGPDRSASFHVRTGAPASTTRPSTAGEPAASRVPKSKPPPIGL